MVTTPLSPEATKHVNQANRIADALEEQVFSGFYQNGDRLDEARISQHFGVSRTPVRQAFQRLVTVGLATQLPRRGVFVQYPSASDLRQMFEVMAEIEAVCGRLAAVRMSKAELGALKKVNAACLKAIEARDADTYASENEFFHRMIYVHAGNAYLADQASRYYRLLKPYRRVQFRLQGRMDQSDSEHIDLLDAFTEGDARRAEKTLRAHVGTQGNRFYRQMTQLRVTP